jgi:hypothetical protein
LCQIFPVSQLTRDSCLFTEKTKVMPISSSLSFGQSKVQKISQPVRVDTWLEKTFR